MRYFLPPPTLAPVAAPHRPPGPPGPLPAARSSRPQRSRTPASTARLLSCLYLTSIRGVERRSCRNLSLGWDPLSWSRKRSLAVFGTVTLEANRWKTLRLPKDAAISRGVWVSLSVYTDPESRNSKRKPEDKPTG